VYLVEILNVWNRTTAAHEFVIIASDHAKAHFDGLGLDSRFRFVRAPASRARRVLWQQVAMPALLAKLRVDVHWGAGFVLPLLSRRRMVLSVHDLTFQLFPEVHELVKRYYFPAVIKASVRKARTIIAISESTRKDLHELIPGSRGKTIVTLLAARSLAEAALPTQNGSAQDTEDFFLFVGTVEPRKNLSRLIAAWNAVDPQLRGRTRLLVVGAAGWMVGEVLHRLDAEDSIRFLGHVDDAQLSRLLSKAKAFLYPSLYEGFGLPVVEAMAAGVPVLTSNVGATREIAEGAAILVDPTDERDLRAGLERLLTDAELRSSLSRLGRSRASEFSWDSTAHRTLEAIEQAAAALA
jgi:glycosyltransferase involved in cell wall biosynthesis